MDKYNPTKKYMHSTVELARTVANIAQTVKIDAIICAVETEEFAQNISNFSDISRLVFVTTNSKTHHVLLKSGLNVIRLPILAADKYRQVRYILSVAHKADKVRIGDFVICVLDPEIYKEEGKLVLLGEIDKTIEKLSVPDLLKLTDGIRPGTLEAAISVGCKIARAARRGKRLGAIITLGDSLKILENSKQLVPNPFQGHEKEVRMITNPCIHEALVELAKLDGAFVVRGDGFIQSAGTFLNSPDIEVELAPGLGARHTAAAAATKWTKATAIVISETDGNVRAFSGGKLVLQIDPEVEHGPIAVES